MKLKWAHFIKDELLFFFSEHHAFLLTRRFPTSAVVGYQRGWLEGWEYSSADNPSCQML
jgi:hypothetical protein